MKETRFELIDKRRFAELKQILSEMQPIDIAEIFENCRNELS